MLKWRSRGQALTRLVLLLAAAVLIALAVILVLSLALTNGGRLP